MKKIIVLITIIFFNNIHSQNFKGKVLYNFKVKENLIDSKTINKKDKKYGGMLDFINQSLKKNQFVFELKFNEKESFFYKQNNMENSNNKSYEIANALIKAGSAYYTNRKSNKRLITKEVYGELYIVKSDFNNLNWKLTNEQKKIGKYKCYKAISEVIVNNNKGKFKKAIVAWYAPSLFANFGPKGYGGLPGLILELNEGNFNYLAYKIIINPKKNIDILPPKKGKFITQQELDKLGGNLYKKRKKSFSN